MASKRSRKDFEADLQKQQSPFAFYGTPLPPLDDTSRDDGSYVPVWKQEVTDDRGRKRLHGAFTGGFSAGYFNTVGSKEGWTPSTFVSSRTNRAKGDRSQAQQRPEDFMDDEDIREQEESKNVSTNEGFAGFGTADDAAHQNALTDLLQPAEDTMGIKLLYKMGWKHGHGIGPKTKRRADPDDEHSEVHLFAPDDVPILALAQKTDHRGLGYAGQDGLSFLNDQSVSSRRTQSRVQSDEDEDGERPGLKFASRKQKSLKNKRGAFGVGVLNDTGSDEEDPYSMGPKIAYNKTLGGDKKTKRTKAASGSNANPLLINKPVFVSKKLGSLSSVLRKCHDGRLPLNGFVLEEQLDKFSSMSLSDDRYKPPPVPAEWKPSRDLSSDASPEDQAYQSTVEAAKLSSHNSSTRGALLGEASLPGKSVFDFLTPAAREKLMKVSGKTNLPPALSESLPGISSSITTPPQSSSLAIPELDPSTALQALSRTLSGGFMPYNDDISKAARYKAYLESQANNNKDAGSHFSPSPAPRPSSMTQEDYVTELHEFARAAEVFKPVSGLIASRFTTSTQTSAPGTNASSSSSTAITDPALTDLLTKPASRPKDPMEQAASIGMFGPLTRSITNFYPTRLLCKRFGVALPSHAEIPRSTGTADAGMYGGMVHDDAGGSSSGSSSTTRFQSAGFQRPETDQARGHTPTTDPLPVAHKNINTGQLTIEAPSTVALVEPPVSQAVTIDPDRNEALEQDRPGAAVFRAIFGSDDDGDDDEDDD